MLRYRKIKIIFQLIQIRILYTMHTSILSHDNENYLKCCNFSKVKVRFYFTKRNIKKKKKW